MHDLTKQPEGCAECEALTHGIMVARAFEFEHTKAQDAAIVRAVRAAAGTENPVAWLLNTPGSGDPLDIVINIRHALRAELEAPR